MKSRKEIFEILEETVNLSKEAFSDNANLAAVATISGFIPVIVELLLDIRDRNREEQ